MKILIITNSLSGGGAESSMRLINSTLRRSGINSTLLCLNKTDGEIVNNGEIELRREWKSGILQTLKNFVDFVKVIRGLSPNIIIVNCELPELYTALSPIRLKKIICVEHTSKPWAARELLGNLVRRMLEFRQATWVTVNKDQSKIWPSSAKPIFILNPVEPPNLAIEMDAHSNFVFIGRLRIEKGIEMILEAISSEGQRIEVFGSGDLEENLKVKYHNIAKFHGFVKEPWGLINRDHILINASEYEGDGKVIVEGILADVPILLLDNSDLRRFELAEQTYFSDIEILRRKIKECLLNRENFRTNSQKRDSLRQERNLVAIMSTWKNLLNQIL